jgi:hypothetical protein
MISDSITTARRADGTHEDHQGHEDQEDPGFLVTFVSLVGFVFTVGTAQPGTI